MVDNLRAMTSALKSTSTVSYEILPTMFQNQGVKTIMCPTSEARYRQCPLDR